MPPAHIYQAQEVSILYLMYLCFHNLFFITELSGKEWARSFKNPEEKEKISQPSPAQTHRTMLR